MTLTPARTPLCLAPPPSAAAGAVVSVVWVGLLCACGGGGSTREPADTNIYPAITVTPAYRLATANAGVPVQFAGGLCAGGNNQLKALWTWGDGQEFTESDFGVQTHTHTYAYPGYYPLRVRCFDTSTTTWATSSSYIEVFP